MVDFKIRALELHSVYAWDYRYVLGTLDFIEKNGMNTLILHRNDFIDRIIYPGKYFGCERDEYASIFERYQDIFRKLYKYTPTRRSGPYQRRAYFKRVLHEASVRGIDVYIQNKELYFPDILLEFFPELVKDGKICANEPFWWEFTKVKYTELLEEFPGLTGVITAPATGESKVSISSNRCTCELCQNTPPEKWYKDLIMAMYEPLAAQGKKLIVRDFVFDSAAHREISDTMERLPSDIAMCFKNTPHDYYPTFPDNPRIGNVGEREQWVEFDSMGQYFGWGIGPAIMTRDSRRRLKFAKDKGVSGVVVRMDWESLDGHTVADALNSINLYSFAALTNDLTVDGHVICDQWLRDKNFYAEGADETLRLDTAKWLERITDRMWPITSRTCFVNDCVFSDSSNLPVSLDHALWLAEEKNSLKDWDPSKANALDVTVENLQKIIDEKDSALKDVQELFDEVLLGNPGLNACGYKYLVERMNLFVYYVRAFRIATHAIMLTKYALENPTDTERRNLLEQRLAEMLTLVEELNELYTTTSYQHIVYILLDSDRLIALHKDLTHRLNSGNK